MKKYIIRIVDIQQWVLGVTFNEKVNQYQIYQTTNRRAAKVYLESELDFWEGKDRFEPVHLPEDEWMRLQGEEIAPRLPGFEEVE